MRKKTSIILLIILILSLDIVYFSTATQHSDILIYTSDEPDHNKPFVIGDDIAWRYYSSSGDGTKDNPI